MNATKTDRDALRVIKRHGPDIQPRTIADILGKREVAYTMSRIHKAGWVRRKRLPEFRGYFYAITERGRAQLKRGR